LPDSVARERFAGVGTMAIVPALQRVLPWFGALLPVAAFPPIVSLADDLPPMWHWAMLESRLRKGEPRVDFMACVARLRGIPGSVPSLRPPSMAAAHHVLDAWGDAGNLVAKAPLIWLEWDVVDGVVNATLVSVCVDPGFLHEDETPVDRVLQRTLAKASIDLLVEDRELARRFVAGIDACVESLPDGVGLLHVAPLHTRGLPTCRLTLGMRPPQLLAWLERMRWPGDFATVVDWLPSVVPPWQRVFVQVETDGRLGPYLGLETRPTSPGFPERKHRAALLARLVERGLADEDKARALLGWPGAITEPASNSILERTMYAKLVIAAGGIEAKAYTGFHRDSYHHAVA
jgi:hypothetical protein